MTEVIDYSSKPQEETIKIDGSEYTLVEASSDSVCKWKNRLIGNTIFGANGKPKGVRNVADQEPFLVSLCLIDPRTKKSVPEAVVRTWTNKLITILFKKAQEISDLKDEVADENQTSLKEALETSGAPCAWVELQQFVKSLAVADDEEISEKFTSLDEWLNPEDPVKN